MNNIFENNKLLNDSDITVNLIEKNWLCYTN